MESIAEYALTTECRAVLLRRYFGEAGRDAVRAVRHLSRSPRAPVELLGADRAARAKEEEAQTHQSQAQQEEGRGRGDAGAAHLPTRVDRPRRRGVAADRRAAPAHRRLTRAWPVRHDEPHARRGDPSRTADCVGAAACSRGCSSSRPPGANRPRSPLTPRADRRRSTSRSRPSSSGRSATPSSWSGSSKPRSRWSSSRRSQGVVAGGRVLRGRRRVKSRRRCCCPPARRRAARPAARGGGAVDARRGRVLRAPRSWRAQKTVSPAELDRATATAEAARARRDLAAGRARPHRRSARRSTACSARARCRRATASTHDTALVRIDAVDRLRLRFTVPEVALTAMRVGCRCEIAVAPFPGETLPRRGLLRRAVARSRRTAACCSRRGSPNADQRAAARPLREHRSSRWPATRRRSSSPSRRVAYDADGPFVWRVGAGDAAERVPVELGIRAAGTRRDHAGLAAGDRIVSAGTHKVVARRPRCTTCRRRLDRRRAARPDDGGAAP